MSTRPAIRDTILTIRSEVVTTVTEYTVIVLRCGRCGHESEIRHELYESPPGCPPHPAIPRTSTCTRCGRTRRTDNAILPEVSPW